MKKIRIRFGFKTLALVTLLAAGGAWWYVIGFGLWLDYRDRAAFRGIPEYELDQSEATRLSNQSIEGLVTIIGDSRLKHWHIVNAGFPLADGRYVSDGADGTIRFWDLESGEAVKTILADQVLVSGDGKRFFTRKGERIEVFDTDGDVLICQADLPQKPKKNRHAAWASNRTGTRIALVRNFEILIFDVAKKTLRVEKLAGVKRPRAQPFFDASGELLLLTQDSKIYFLPLNDEPKDDEPKDDEPKDDEPKDDEPKDGKAGFVEMVQENNRTSSITAMIQSSDPRILFVGDMSGKLGQLDLDTRRITEFPSDGTGNVQGLAILNDQLIYNHLGEIQSRSLGDFSAKAKWAEAYDNMGFLNRDFEGHIIGGRKNRLHVWKESKEITLGIQETWTPTCIEFSLDGWSLAIGGDDGIIRIFRVGSWQTIREIEFGSNPITSLCFSSTGQLAARDSSRVVVFENDKGQQVFELAAPRVRFHHAMAFSKDGSLFAFGVKNQGLGFIEVIDLRGNASSKLLSIPGREAIRPGFLRLKERNVGRLNITGNLYFSHKNDYVFAATAFQNVSIWDTKTGNFLGDIGKPELLTGTPGDAKAVMSPDGSLIVMQSVSGAIGVWHGFEGRILSEVDDPIHYAVESSVHEYDFRFSNSGKYLASVTDDGFLRIRDMQNFEVLHSIQLSGPGSKIPSVRYSRDDRYIATLNGNGTVYIIRNPTSVPSE